MIVRVAIDLALDRLFDYEVPEALQKKLAVGQLLSVPFGHREARGFVLEVRGDRSRDDRVIGCRSSSDQGVDLKPQPAFKLKPITAIVDETPFFSPELLELVKRLSS